jgi:pyridoxal phosphate enzyme (YggS family)
MMKENIDNIERKIQAACDRAGRKRCEVTLIAVSKTKPNEALEEAYNLGMRHFGENKVQELAQKFEDLDHIFKDKVSWHLIGHLQTNKVKYIVDKTVLIHSVDSLHLAQKIEEEAAKKNLVCDVLLEVNIAEEESKYGVKPEEVLPLLQQLYGLSHVRVRGLMTVAPYVENPEKNREYFMKLRQLYVDIKTKNDDNICDGSFLPETASKIRKSFEYFDTLSMGMTGDFEVAIEEGATMVRIGTGIFGERDYSKKG